MNSLRFETSDDALTHAKQLVERFGNDVPPREGCGLSERYLDGKVRFEFTHLPQRADSKDKLIVSGVPLVDRHHRADPASVEFHCSGERGWNENLVYFRIANFVQTPKGAVPAFVWFERSEIDTDGLGNTASPPLELSAQIVLLVGEGEFGGANVEVLGPQNGGRENGVVQRGSERVDGIKDNAGQLVGKRARDSDLYEFLTERRLTLTESAIGLRLVEEADLELQFFGDYPLATSIARLRRER